MHVVPSFWEHLVNPASNSFIESKPLLLIRTRPKASATYSKWNRAKCEPNISLLLIHHGSSQFVNPTFHRDLSTQGSSQMYACTTHQDDICKLRLFTKPKLSKHIITIHLM